MIRQFSLPPFVNERSHGVDGNTLFSTVNSISQSKEVNWKKYCRSVLYERNR